MNQVLQDIYQSLIEQFKADERVLAGWEYGSLGKGTSDQFSDVDPVFVIRDEDFAAFDRQLPELFTRFGFPIRLWWPEGFNNDEARNYAIFIQADDLLQYDMTIARASSLKEGGWGKVFLVDCGKIEVFFDKTGLVARSLAELHAPGYSTDRLVWQIERYWVYAFIMTKYLNRRDLYKAIYCQQTLMSNHLDVLRALYPPDTNWSWWPWTVKHILSAEQQHSITLYFSARDLGEITGILKEELDAFSAHARQACERQGKVYPEMLEQDVRAHLGKHVWNARGKV